MATFTDITRRSGRAYTGFTLIDLLVVISIIALLIALRLPALAAAKSAANSVACGAHERSMGQAMQEYLQTWKGFYPGDEVVDGTGASNNFCCWVPRLMTMMGPGSAKLFYCPSRTIDMEYIGYVWPVRGSGTIPAGYGRGTLLRGYGYQNGQEVLYMGGNWIATQGPQLSLPAFSYGYNDWGTLGGFPQPGTSSYGQGLGGDIGVTFTGTAGGYAQVPESAVVDPAAMIAITDRIDDATHGNPSYTFIYNSDPTRSNIPLPQTSIPGIVQWAEWPGAIHGGDSNVVWADGHVSIHSQQELVQVNPNKGGGQMNMDWNNDHQTHAPETGTY